VRVRYIYRMHNTMSYPLSQEVGRVVQTKYIHKTCVLSGKFLSQNIPFEGLTVSYLFPFSLE
jgi:hypothetical protein